MLDQRTVRSLSCFRAGYRSLVDQSLRSAVLVEKICEYMSFKAQYEAAGPKEEVPLNEFTERIPPEIALEL